MLNFTDFRILIIIETLFNLITCASDQLCYTYLMVGPQDTCISCSFNSYIDRALGPGSLGVPFPSNKCLLRKAEILKKKILVSRSNSTPPAGLAILFDNHFETFLEAIRFSEQFANQYLEAEVLILLGKNQGQKEYGVFPSEIPSSYQYFRRISCNITIMPLFCEVYADENFCLRQDEKISIYIKSMNFQIFVANAFTLSAITLDASDIILDAYKNPEEIVTSCLNQIVICCNKNYNPLFYQKYCQSLGTDMITSYLVYLEPMRDSEHIKPPKFSLINCTILLRRNLVNNLWGMPSSFEVLSSELRLQQGLFLSNLPKQNDYNSDPLYAATNFTDGLNYAEFINVSLINSTIEFNFFLEQEGIGVLPLLYIYTDISFNLNVSSMQIYDRSSGPRSSFRLLRVEKLVNDNYMRKQNTAVIYLNQLVLAGIDLNEAFRVLNADIFILSTFSVTNSTSTSAIVTAINTKIFVARNIFLYNVSSRISSDMNLFIILQGNEAVLEIWRVSLFKGLSISITDCAKVNLYDVLFSFSYFPMSLLLIKRGNVTADSIGFLNEYSNPSSSSSLIALQEGNCSISKFKLHSLIATNVFAIISCGHFSLTEGEISDNFYVFLLFSILNGLKSLEIYGTKLSNNQIFHLVLLLTKMNYPEVPTITIDRSELKSHVMKSPISDFFCSFTYLNLRISNSVFDSIVRYNHTTLPIAIFFISREATLEVNNCSFTNVGYAYEPTYSATSYNFPIFLISNSYYFVFTYCTFSSDNTISIFNGYIHTAEINWAEIKFSQFIAPKQNTNNFTYKGLLISRTFNVKFINNTVRNFKNLNKLKTFSGTFGSILFTGEYELMYIYSNNYLEIIGNFFENCECTIGGAMFVNNYHRLFLNNNIFFNSHAYINSGTIAILNSNYTQMINNFIINSSAIDYSAVGFQFINNLFIYKSKLFTLHASQKAAIFLNSIENAKIMELQAVDVKSSDSAGFLLVANSLIEVTSAFIADVWSGNEGGVIFITTPSSISLINITTKTVSAKYGGFASLPYADQVLIINCQIENSTAEFNGGFLFLDECATVYIFGSSISYSTASVNGLIFITTDTSEALFMIEDIEFESNGAQQGSAVYMLSSSKIYLRKIKITNCRGVLFYLSRGVRSIAFFDRISIEDFIMPSRAIESRGFDFLLFNSFVKVVSYDSTVITVKEGIVFFKNNFFFVNEDYGKGKIDVPFFSVMGAHILMLNIYFSAILGQIRFFYSVNTVFIIENALIEGGYSLNLGVITAEKCIVRAKFIAFLNNIGTCFYMVLSDFIVDYAIFKNNTRKSTIVEWATEIEYLNNHFSNSLIRLTGVLILRNAKQAHSISITNVRSFSIFKSLFETGPGLTQNSQALSLINVPEFLMSKCLIKEFISLKNGGFIELILEESVLSQKSFQLLNHTYFYNCLNYENSAVFYFFNTQNTTIAFTYFYGNKVSKKQGEMEYSHFGYAGCGTILCFLYKHCTIEIKNSIFENNYAISHVPAVYSNTPLKELQEVYYINNSDGSNFTNKSSSFPLKIYILSPKTSDSSTISFSHSERTLQRENIDILETQILEIKSGVPINLTFEITDSQDQTINFDNSTLVSIQNKLFPVSFTKIVNSNTRAASNGFVYFHDLQVKGLTSTVESFDLVFTLSLNFQYFQNPLKLSFNISFAFEKCVLGQIILSDNSCFTCEPGKYSNIDPYNIPLDQQKCFKCPPQAQCPGGDLVFPGEGYWRYVNEGENYVECFIPDACIGPQSFRSLEENKQGVCREGHYGIMCNDCVYGFGKQSLSFVCNECERTTVVLRPILGFLSVLFYVIFVSYTYSIQNENNKKYAQLFIFIKILTNFMQTISLITFFKFKWSLPSLRLFFSITNSLLITTEEFLLNDCFIQVFLEPNEIWKTYTLRVSILVFLPIIFFLLASIFWSLRYCYKVWKPKNKRLINLKKTKKELIIKIFASLIASLFLLHPLIAKTCLNMINCISIDNNSSSSSYDTYLLIYPNFRCWTDSHIRTVFYFVLPAFLVWGFGFPALLLLLLKRQDNFRHSTSIIKSKIKSSVINESSPIQIKPAISLGVSVQSSYIPSSGKSVSKNLTFKKILMKSCIFEFLKFGYKEEHYYWECLLFFKKLIISILLNLNQWIGFTFTVLALISLLSIHFYLQKRLKPYFRDDLNQTELQSIVSVALIFVSLILISYEADPVISLEYIVSIAIIVLHSGFLINLFWKLFKAALAQNLHKDFIRKIKSVFNKIRLQEAK